MKKKGQFYLAAAIIIIALIVSFAGITNFLKKTESVKVYDLKDELGIEGGQVLDYGVYNEYNNSQTNGLLKDFTQNYSGYVEKGFNLYFVFGNAHELVIAGYKDLVTGTISYNQGGSKSMLSISQGVYNATVIDNPSTDKPVAVKIDEAEYNFNLNKAGQSFYFVIYQKTGGGTYVEKG